MMKDRDSFGTVRSLDVGGRTFRYFSLAAAEEAGLGDIGRLPVSLKIFLENLLRNEDGATVTPGDIRAVADWAKARQGGEDVAFHPSRIVMPDSSGVPLLADLAAMRDAMVGLGGDPGLINPAASVDMVIDHSVIVEAAARPDALGRNMDIEYERNAERYEFLRWAQGAFSNLRIVPPGQGIVHQVNLEFLARVVWTQEAGGETWAYPDTVLGIDSHTPMINGIGVLGWGCGGIEAGAAMLGQPVSMSVPEVVGVKLTGRLADGVTSTDLALTVTELLRKTGVVQKFVEFFGPGLSGLPLPARATIANMAPEYGATVGFFPVDAETLAYLRVSGRDENLVALVEAYSRAQGLWRDDDAADPIFSQVVDLDLSAVEPSIAGPRRPQDRVALSASAPMLRKAVDEVVKPESRALQVPVAGTDYSLGHGDLVLAAITSCTNTSTPSVMVAAGLLAQKAVARGLRSKPWIKTSFGPGSQVVAEYLEKAGLQAHLDTLGFNIVGFGCTTCMGNSGPLDPAITDAIEQNGLAATAVLSGNRNFEGRVHPLCRFNYLASPPLVVAFAIAGTLDIDLTSDPIGEDSEGRPVYLRDIWPSANEVEEVIRKTVTADIYRARYADAFTGDARWQGLPVRGGGTFDWNDASWYIRRPPFFTDTEAEPEPVEDIAGARILVMLGSSITTDHISPVGSIARESSAGRFLIDNGIPERDFNSYAARRVNHDVMIRGTFGNVRLKNELVPGIEGGHTRHMPDGRPMTIYEASQAYRREGVPLVVVAGADYGVGSSRDWAAKGTRLLGIRAVIAEGFERIHRSNLIGMGVLPLEFEPGQGRTELGLDGSETFDIADLDAQLAPAGWLPCRLTRSDGRTETIRLRCRLDTGYEVEYFRNGGILHFMLRRMLKAA